MSAIFWSQVRWARCPETWRVQELPSWGVSKPQEKQYHQLLYRLTGWGGLLRGPCAVVLLRLRPLLHCCDSCGRGLWSAVDCRVVVVVGRKNRVELWIWLVVGEAWSQEWRACGGFVEVVVGKGWSYTWVWVAEVDTLAWPWEQVETGCWLGPGALWRPGCCW